MSVQTSQGFDSVIVREGFHRFVQILLNSDMSELQHLNHLDWLPRPAKRWGKGQAVNPAQHRLGEQYGSLPALGVTSAHDLWPRASSCPILPLLSVPASAPEIQNEDLLLTNSVFSFRFLNHGGAEKAGNAERQQAAPDWEAQG